MTTRRLLILTVKAVINLAIHLGFDGTAKELRDSLADYEQTGIQRLDVYR